VTAVTLKPGDAIGILGGGQLGRMLAMAAARLGLRCQVFSPDPDSPAFDVVANATCAEYADVEALELFANDVDVITYEFENVPASAAARSISPVESCTRPCLATSRCACVPLPAPGGPSSINLIYAAPAASIA